METILYFYPAAASFVSKDLQILESEFRVKSFLFAQTSQKKTFLGFFKQSFFLLRHFQTKILVIQFGGYHSFLPCLFGYLFNKKTILILGGTDCASFPEFNYGNYRKKALGYFTRKSIEWAKIIVPVHKAMVDYPYTYFEAQNPRQGFKNFTGKVNGRIEVAEYGFEPPAHLNATNRELGFVCIAGFNRENIYYLKGLDLICKIAPHFPQYPFTIVGAKGKYVNYPVPENVKILPFIHEDEKIAILNKYRFYFQLSLSEGFPNALCEAMVNGMIAIVSDVCSMPDIVNGAGFVLKHRDEKELIALIENILLEDLDQLSLKNAEKIRSHYLPQNRKKRLLEIIKS